MPAVTLALPLFMPPRLEARPLVTPFLKWPGGKSQELPAIAAAAPPLTGRLIDPFVGGGAILFAAPPEVAAWANDACPDLVGLYTSAAARDETVIAAIAGFGSVGGIIALVLAVVMAVTAAVGVCPIYRLLHVSTLRRS